MTVGDRIKARRIELGMSQAELAQKMGYSGKQTVSKAENHGDNLTTTKVSKYAQALDVSFSYLMGWEEDPKRQIMNAYAETERKKSLVNLAKSLDENELNLIDTYRSLDEESKRQLVLMLAFLKEQSKK